MSHEWVDLREFLGRGAICHPTIISELKISGVDGIIMRLQGAAWWKPGASTEAAYEFRFQGIKDAHFHPNLITHVAKETPWEGDEILECFEHAPISELPWGRGQAHNIYCSSPIKNPQKLLLTLETALHASNSPYDVISHLNDDHGRLDVFFQLCRQNLFKLGTFRGDILDAIKKELIRQDVRFTEFSSATEIDGCAFTCIEDSFILSDIAQAREIR